MKRFRLLLIAAAIVLAGTIGFLRPASAAPGPDAGNAKVEAVHTSEEDIIKAAEKLAIENKATDVDAECIAILAEGGTVDECHESKSPLMPETNEIIYGAIGFFIIFGVLWKLAIPSMKKGMQARTDRIKNDLDAAETQRTEAESILAEYQAQLADARTESARIIEEARQAADEVRSGLQAKAEADIAELRARALADIEAAKAQISDDLRREVSALAIGAAEQVVGRNLDQETNVALVEAYINQVGANS